VPSQLRFEQRHNVRHHRSFRKRIAPLVEAGLVRCARCLEFIQPDQPWDLGHVDGSERKLISGPEHRGCNRATSTHKGAQGEPAVVEPSDWALEDGEPFLDIADL
jgi:hypothetical protein